MSIATDPTTTGGDQAEDHTHDHPGDGQYVKIALILAAITGIEVATYYTELNNGIIAALYVMMILKFVIVIGYFMHLKYDSKIFRWMFVGGLVLAVAVYLITVSAMGFFVGDFVG